MGLVLSAMGVWWAVLPNVSEHFEVGLRWAGRTSDGYSSFHLYLTNQNLHIKMPSSFQFQWADRHGEVDACHATFEVAEKQSGVGSAFIAVPATATRLRVRLCGEPGPLRQNVAAIVDKLPWGLRSVFPIKWLHERDIHSPLPWIANPAPNRTAASESVRCSDGFMRRCRLLWC